MKKQILALCAAVAVVASVFTGCKKDEAEKPSPTITITAPSGGTATVEAGNTVPIAFTATAGSGINLKKVEMTIAYDGGAATPQGDTTLNTNTITLAFTSGTRNIAGTEVYTITATDENGKTATATITITVTKTTAGDIYTYNTVLLGAQAAAPGSFYASSTNTVYSQADAKTNASKVDFLYFYGATNKATIASPDDADAATIYNNGTTGLQTWSTKNATKLKLTTVTVAAFDAIADDATIVTEATGAADTKVNNLAVDKVFAFKTQAGKLGLVKVTQVGTDNAGTITLTVKVQK